MEDDVSFKRAAFYTLFIQLDLTGDAFEAWSYIFGFQLGVVSLDSNFGDHLDSDPRQRVGFPLDFPLKLPTQQEPSKNLKATNKKVNKNHPKT